jgi:protein-S-isoprenylcysteine O-methyltransferase Ste14
MSRLPSLGERGEGWFVLQVLLLAAVGSAGFLLGPDWRDPARTVTTVAGLVLIAGGILLGVAGIRDLDRAVSPFPRPARDTQLVEHGVYRHVRHPIYVGVTISAVGWSLLTASLPALGCSVLLAVLLDLKARREEHWLREHYPAYAAYQRRTRRFVPRIY